MQIAEQFKRSPWAILTGAVVLVAILLYAASVDRPPSRQGISVLGVVGVLGATMPLGRAMGICALSSYAVALVAAMLLPERGGADLRAARPGSGRDDGDL